MKNSSMESKQNETMNAQVGNIQTVQTDNTITTLLDGKFLSSETIFDDNSKHISQYIKENDTFVEKYQNPNGKLHREEGPACMTMDKDGNVLSLEWWEHGLLIAVTKEGKLYKSFDCFPIDEIQLAKFSSAYKISKGCTDLNSFSMVKLSEIKTNISLENVYNLRYKINTAKEEQANIQKQDQSENS